MEQITIVIDSMEDVRREIDNCQRKAMTSVVELGYILRKADDAGLYREQGYTSIFKFAKEEYGWSQSQTSRFMDINREFSEGGYSTILKEQYRGYGQAKLAEMLTLPEIIREELDPEMKRDDIRELKSGIRQAEQEDKETAFEAAVLDTERDGAGLQIEKLFSLPEMAEKMAGLYPLMQKAAEGETVPDEDIRMVLSSTGFGTVRAGGVMFFWKKDGVAAIKGTQKRKYTYMEMLEMMNRMEDPAGKTPEEWYRSIYGKELPGTGKEELVRDVPRQTEQDKPETASGIETSTIEAVSGKMEEETKEQLKEQTETRQSAEEIQAGQSREDKQNRQEESQLEPVSGIETSTNREDTGRKEAAEEEEQEQEEDECHYCTGRRSIMSNDGEYWISLHKNGLARIGNAKGSAVMEFSYCPVCGKELYDEDQDREDP